MSSTTCTVLPTSVTSQSASTTAALPEAVPLGVAAAALSHETVATLVPSYAGFSSKVQV